MEKKNLPESKRKGLRSHDRNELWADTYALGKPGEAAKARDDVKQFWAWERQYRALPAVGDHRAGVNSLNYHCQV